MSVFEKAGNMQFFQELYSHIVVKIASNSTFLRELF